MHELDELARGIGIGALRHRCVGGPPTCVPADGAVMTTKGAGFTARVGCDDGGAVGYGG